MERRGYVYLIKTAEGCKIGQTKSLPSRLSSLFSARGEDPDNVFACLVDDCRGYEKELHQRFSRQRGLREFFNLSPSQFAELVEEFRAIGEASDLNGGDIELIKTRIELLVKEWYPGRPSQVMEALSSPECDLFIKEDLEQREFDKALSECLEEQKIYIREGKIFTENRSFPPVCEEWLKSANVDTVSYKRFKRLVKKSTVVHSSRKYSPYWDDHGFDLVDTSEGWAKVKYHLAMPYKTSWPLKDLTEMVERDARANNFSVVSLDSPEFAFWNPKWTRAILLKREDVA